VRPALAIARGCEWLERALYERALAAGRLGFTVGRAVRRSDEQGIDRLIFSVVQGTVNLGDRVRSLQNGLIHRELAITVVTTALIFAAVLIPLLVL
jgi:NADH-quinone oxidoreductase subunit L